MKKITVDISGMHCRSCEILVEGELKKISKIKSVLVNNRKGTAEIEYEGHLSPAEIERAVCCAGYRLGKEEKPFFSRKSQDYKDLVLAIFIAIGVYLIIKSLGLFQISTASNNYSSLPVVFLIGLTAGISTCMALVGGLILGASAKYAEDHPSASTLQKFQPHLIFNLGRILSYTFFGAIVGLLGSFFQLSSSTVGLLVMMAGAAMLLLGAQLLEIFPILHRINFSLPKNLTQLLRIKEQSNPFILGAATFFLPCAFTQAMILFAAASGSALIGAITLGTFAVGTAPGLLGIGGLTCVIKGSIAKIFFKTTGIIVILLGVFNIQNGYNLTGWDVMAIPKEIFATAFLPSSPVAPPVQQNGIQIINMTQDGSGYRPNNFTIKRGVPVRWVINSLSPYTCAASIVLPRFNIRKSLQTGENVIEFTPTENGRLPFSCSMGMFRGVFNVVD